MPDTTTDNTPIVGTLRDGLGDVLAFVRHETFAPSIPTGATYLDDLLAGGLHPGQLAVIAAVNPDLARDLLLTWCHHAAVERTVPTLVFAVPAAAGDNHAHDISTRLTTIGCGPDPRNPDYHQIQRLIRAPIMINDTARTIDVIAVQAQLAADHFGVRLLVVDGIGNLLDDARPTATTADVVDHATVTLKSLAHALPAAVLVTSTAAKAPASRANQHVPALTDLAGSGSLENDADLVLFVHPDPDSPHDKLRTTLAKHRNGPRANYRATYDAVRGILAASP
jgi:replicative DNA helicase